MIFIILAIAIIVAFLADAFQIGPSIEIKK